MDKLHQSGLLNTVGMTSARVMRRLHRERHLKAANIVRQAPPPPAAPDWQDAEFSLPDEERDYSLRRVKPCPHCRNALHLPLLRRWFEGGIREARYQVCCTNPDCEQATAPFTSSQAAVQCWEVTAAMMNQQR